MVVETLGEAGLIAAIDFGTSIWDFKILLLTVSSVTVFECLKMLIISPIGVIPILNKIKVT